MLGHIPNPRVVSRSVLLVLSILVLLGFIGTSEAIVYRYLFIESQATVGSPMVVLQNGTTGTSTIYTTNASARVSVSGYGYDFVDNNDTNVDLSANKGTQSNFTAQKYGPDLTNDTLTEENTGDINDLLWLYVDSDDWRITEWDAIGTRPYLDAIDYYSDPERARAYISTSAGDEIDGDYYFADSGKSTETINSVTVQVYARNSDSDSLEIYIWNGSSYAFLGAQGLTPSWEWVNFTATTVLDTWAKIDGAKMYVKSLTNGGPYEIDCARLQVDYDSTNYEFDVEVQWTSVDYDETYEELCIRTGAFSGSEDIMMYVWNVSASDWHLLYNLTMNSWNNVSVTDWLNDENFTVRFLGGTESGDAIQNYWDIDATLLHICTETDYNYDHVLRVNNTVTDSWEIRLRKYSDSNINRLENCTIYFRNSTNTNSTQIIIENGSFSQTEGQWFNLTSLETIYVAMTVEANSTGTSNVYTYLEVRTPGTTTYRLYVITFEIT